MDKELAAFIDQWTEDENKLKPLFQKVCALLASMKGVSLEYKGRPGISHSLRARHAAQSSRPLFVLVDVIDDDPAARWLSVCFYADLVTDPDGLGDVVPAGLLGEDACCFDIDAPEAMDDFLLERLQEAARNAAQS